MAVTRSTPADRRRQAAAPAGKQPWAAPPWGQPQAARTRETLLLAGAYAAVLLGLFLVYQAVSRPFEEVTAQLSRGEVVDLNAVSRPEQLVPLLDFVEERSERSFVAERILQHLSRPDAGKVPNVGELGKIRVPAAEVAESSRLPELGQRLEDAGEGAASIRLLTSSELRRLKPLLVVRTPSQFRRSFLLWGGLFLLSFLAVHVGFRIRRFGGDELMLPLLLILSGLGLILMLSVRDPLRDQALFRVFIQGVAMGCALLLAASQIDYERSPLPRMSFLPLLAAFGLSALLIVFGSGPGSSDAKVNLFGFQPVEVIKILVVLFLAGYFQNRWEFLRELPETRGGLGGMPRWARLPKLEYALPPVLAIGVVLMFFFLQRDLGPALILSFTFFFLYAVARGRSTLALAGTALVVAGFFVGYMVGFPRTVTGRIAMWLSPWDNAFRGGDHLAQSLWTLAGGGLTGTGLGLGQPGYVPEIHTDMVLAAIGEELGFLGLLAVFGLYAVLLARGFRAALRAERAYGFFLALGLTLVLGLPVLLIAGGVVGLFPLSGVVSPFLSYGRSAMLANFVIVGVLLALSSRPAGAAGSAGSAAVQKLRGPVRWIQLGVAVVMAAILLRAGWVQIVRDERVLTRGALTIQADGLRRFQYNPRLEEIARDMPRGAIVDRNGIPLATSDPGDLEEHRTALLRLGASLPANARPGTRIYPFGGRTFHLLGDLRSRTNWGASNTSFAERDQRIRLQGYDDFAGITEVTQPDGRVTREIQRDYRELLPLLRHRHDPGHPDALAVLQRDRTLRMSVDIRLQLRAAEILERYVRDAGSPGGAAVFLDPANGDLLASVSHPWPAKLPVEVSEETESELIDRARYGIYPPGSTFKVVTAMAALREDPGLARKTYVCERLPDGRVGNRVRGWGRPIRDDLTVKVPHGSVNLEKAISRSCNAYFAQLAVYDVKAGPLLEMAQRLGISVAQPNTAEQAQEALPQASYGQGQVTATPFQMTRVAATVAAGGQMPEGRWILGEANPRKAEPEAVLDASLAKVLARDMRLVVTEGTASAYVGGVQPGIAGKTGTAEVQGKASHSWFIGYAPYEAQSGKRLAFGVIVEHGGYGGRVAARAAGEIVREAARLGVIQTAPQETP